MSRSRNKIKKLKKKLSNSNAKIVHIDSKPKKIGHHTNPKLALKWFAENGKLEKLDLHNRTGQSGFKVATVENNFYTVYGNSNPDVFEDAMCNEVETPAAPLFKEIVENNKWPLTPEDNIIFSRFITLQFLRSPAKRDIDLLGANHNFRKSSKYKTLSKYMSDETIENEMKIQHMNYWFNEEGQELVYHVHDMKKVLVKFEEHSLATSASPITLIFNRSDIENSVISDETSDQTLLAWPTWKMERSLAAFYPISRKLGLVLLPPDSSNLESQIFGDENTAFMFNWLIKRFSKEVFYHPNDSKYFKDFYIDKDHQSSLFMVKKFLKKLN